MIAGLILSGEEGVKSELAFLGDEGTSCHSVDTNEDIVELLDEKEPEVLAVDVGTVETADEFTEQEEELKEEGHIFTPNSQNQKKMRRLEVLKAHIKHHMVERSPEVIRFEPKITADELALHDDEALKSMGVDTSCITSARQFDAMLGAVTARFYSMNQFEDMGVIVPEPMEN